MTWPISVVGAIWPLVMPYTALLTKKTVMFSPAVGRVQDLGRADGGQVAVALVRDHDLVRLRALQPGRHRRRAAVRSLHRVDVEVVVQQHRTADRRHHDRALPNAQLIDRLGNEAVDDAVRAARTVIGDVLGQGIGPLVDDLALFHDLGRGHDASGSVSVRHR